MTAKKKPAAKRAPAAKAAAKKRPAAGQRGAAANAKAKRDAAAKRAKRSGVLAAEKRAADAGAKGARLPAAQMGLRNSLILARHEQGASWAEIATEAGVSARTAQRVVEHARALPSPVDARPMELLKALAAGYLRSIADYEGMAFAWQQSNQTAALGAKKAADETRARLAALMADVGKLPENLELFRSEMEMRRIAEEMVEVLEGVVSGERSAVEALAVFGQVLAGARDAVEGSAVQIAAPGG